MMVSDFYQGQKVVCVDDFFAPEIAKCYQQLPKEGITYVVRQVDNGISFDDGPSRKSVVAMLLLVGVVNTPFQKHGREQGFNSKRFRPLQELKDESRERNIAYA